MNLTEIREAFDFFDDWEDKYRFVIDLGKTLPSMAEDLRVPDNIVRGCQSQVWLVAHANDGGLTFEIDSDAHIVRGLIGIVQAAYQNQTPAEILAFDMEQLFEELDLIKHLSPTRGNGLRSMVARIHQEATVAPRGTSNEHLD